MFAVMALTACSNSTTFIPASGPSSAQLIKQGELNNSIQVIDIQQDNYLSYSQNISLNHANVFIQRTKPQLNLSAGDVLQITVWEAPPAVLFSTFGAGAESIGLSGGMLNMPEQVISAQGNITIPFVGNVKAAGRTLEQIQDHIRGRLQKIANQPQVVARLLQNNSNTVSLIADRKSSAFLLTPKGERLIDVVPTIADIKQLKTTSFVVERGDARFVIRADDLTRMSPNNIYLYPGDTVRVLQDQYEVSVLGATNANMLLNFGDNGLSIADVLAKTAGMNDFRANPKGVFIFRQTDATRGFNENNAPEVLRFDLSTAEGLLIAQKFQLKNKDMLYVSNSNGTELQKFLSIIGSIISPVSTTTSMTK